MARENKAKDEDKADEPVVVSDPTPHQQYLEATLGEEQVAPVFYETVNPRDNDAFDQGGYVGVDPIYQNYANETEKPYAAEGGADALAEKAYFDSVRGDAREPGDQLKELYGKASNQPDEQ